MMSWLLLGLMASAPASASSWKETISQDIVHVMGNKMVMNSFEICTIGEKRIQLSTHAEASTGSGISRDFLIRYTTTMQTVILAAVMFETSQKISCTPISAPIGTPDLSMNLIMTSDGWQMSFVPASGESRQESNTWAATFPE